MNNVERRVARLAVVWATPCRTCRSRPAVVGIEAGEPEPVYPTGCPDCGRAQSTVCVVIGVDVGAI